MGLGMGWGVKRDGGIKSEREMKDAMNGRLCVCDLQSQPYRRALQNAYVQEIKIGRYFVRAFRHPPIHVLTYVSLKVPVPASALATARPFVLGHLRALSWQCQVANLSFD